MTLAYSEPGPVLWTGEVLSCVSGVAVVRTAQGEVRATYSSRMLARLARDRRVAAGTGDLVVLRRWPDARITIEDVRRTAAPAEVVELRPR